jgi:hypothetical protein
MPLEMIKILDRSVAVEETSGLIKLLEYFQGVDIREAVCINNIL